MNTTGNKGDWKIMKGKLKQKWANLTDEDLVFAEGKMDEMIDRIQKRTGENREAIQKLMDEIIGRTPKQNGEKKDPIQRGVDEYQRECASGDCTVL